MRAPIIASVLTGFLTLAPTLQAATSSFDQAYETALEFAGSYSGTCDNYKPTFSLDIVVTKYDDPTEPAIEISLSKNMRPSTIFVVTKMGENLDSLASPKSPWGYYLTHQLANLDEGELLLKSVREQYTGIKPFAWLEETLTTVDEISLVGDQLKYKGTASDSQFDLDCILNRLP